MENTMVLIVEHGFLKVIDAPVASRTKFYPSVITLGGQCYYSLFYCKLLNSELDKGIFLLQKDGT